MCDKQRKAKGCGSSFASSLLLSISCGRREDVSGNAKIELPRAAGKLWLRMMISVRVADSFRCGEDERSTYYEKSWMLLGNYVKSKRQMWLLIMRREPELYDGN